MAPLVKARFDPAPSRRPTIARPLLSTRLTGTGPGANLLLAPAGCGKTLILREAFETGREGAWLTLGGEHADPACLAEELQAAVGCVPGAGSNWMRIRAAAERLAASGAPLFLDQIERLAPGPSLTLLSRLVDHVAPKLQVWLAGRNDPGLDLWELRLRGWLRTLGAEDIRFSDAEMAELLEAWLGPTAPPGLARWLGGWPAGAALLADEPAAVIDAIARGEDLFPPTAARYLEQALLEPETVETRALLMQLGILQRVDPELLQSLSDGAAPWTSIERLAARFSFIQPDHERDGYVLQPLFAAFLSRRFEQADPAAADAFKARASEWLWMLGRANEAIQLAGRISEPSFAVGVLERMEAWRLGLSEGQAVITGSPDPDGVDGHYPSLALARIYGAARRGDIPAARTDLLRLKRRLEQTAGEAGASLLGFIGAMEVITDVSEDLPTPPGAFERLQQILDEAGGDEVSAASAASLLALLHLGEGRAGEAAAAARTRIGRLEKVHSGQLHIFLHTQAAMADLALGRLEQAVANAEAAYRIGADDPTIDAYEAMVSRAVRAIAHYEADELGPAEALLGQTLAVLEQVNGWFELYAGLFDLAAALHGLAGDMDAVERVLGGAEGLARQRRMPRLLQWTAVLRLREALRTGDLRSAALAAEAADFPPLGPPTEEFDPWRERLRAPAALERARWLQATRRHEAALEALKEVEASPMLQGDRRLWLSHQVTAMSASFSLRRTHATMEHLTAVLDCARACGLQRRINDRREEILRVADWAMANGRRISPANLALLQKLERQAPPQPPAGRALRPAAPHPRGAVSLSLRESGILALIADGCSTKEIASRLNITESTVKSHRKKIHEKLGAGSRSQVLARAREMLLL